MTNENVAVRVLAPELIREAFQLLVVSIPGVVLCRDGGEVTLLVTPQHPWEPSGKEIPTEAVLVCSGDPIDLLRASESGIQVMVSQNDDVGVLAQAIDAARRGQAFCSPRLVPTLLQSLRTPTLNPPPASSVLSAQELAVARDAAQGLTNDEIGRKLHLSTATVKFHLKNAYRKLSIERRAQLAGALRAREEVPVAVNG